MDKARYILFLVATAATILLYITAGNSTLFLYTGLAAVAIKMIEFIMRSIL